MKLTSLIMRLSIGILEECEKLPVNYNQIKISNQSSMVLGLNPLFCNFLIFLVSKARMNK